MDKMKDRGFSVLGFYCESIGPGVMQAIQSRPQVEMKPEYLLIWHRCADFFIESLRFGNMTAPQVSYEKFPASPFSTELEDFQRIFRIADVEHPIKKEALAFFKFKDSPRLELPVMRYGMIAEMIVRNTCSEHRAFSAMFLGKAMDP